MGFLLHYTLRYFSLERQKHEQRRRGMSCPTGEEFVYCFNSLLSYFPRERR